MQEASDGKMTVTAQMQAVVERMDARLSEEIERRRGDESELERLRCVSIK